MSLGAGIFLIAIGAILTWAVENPENSSVNVHVVGVILMLAGLAAFLLALLFWESWAGPGYWVRRRRYVAGGTEPPPQSYWSWGWGPRRRTTYVDEGSAGPPAPPPGPP
jgi:hypothetical protein